MIDLGTIGVIIDTLLHIWYTVYILCSIAEIKRIVRDIERKNGGRK